VRTPFLVAILLATSCLASCSLIKSTYSSQAAGQVVAAKFLVCLTKGNYAGAYGLLSPATKAAFPVSAIKAQGQKANTYLGTAPSISFTGFNSNFGSNPHTDFTYNVSGSKGALGFTIEVVPQGSSWTVDSFSFS